MVDRHLTRIAQELGLEAARVRAAASLLETGATVPFIARYRKEATASLDEVAIAAIRDRSAELAELDARRETVLSSLRGRNLLTEELERSILAAETPSALEDIYLPYRPKRRTRATIAKEQGLEPLAERILAQEPDLDLEAVTAPFLDPSKGVELREEALAGARDIIAERVSEDPAARQDIRELYARAGAFRSKVIEGQEAPGSKFKDYFDAREKIATAPSHRVLAMRRGEREGFLTLRLEVPDDEALAALEQRFVKGRSRAAQEVRLAVHDAWTRLLGPAMETDVRLSTRERADAEAIRIFAKNLRELLLAPPLGRKTTLAIDPGFRTGCKVVCLDRQGKLLHDDVIYPHPPQSRAVEAGRTIAALCERFGVEAIAVGNGTAGRETEALVRALALRGKPPIVLVNESGASVYSASEVAREEFPDRDITVRGAVSIGRRLMDPLAELVKIDPKSIGVGQYQHDVDQDALKRSLDDVVVSCVNGVGVELNTASKELLSYISGLGERVAGAIVARRNEVGPFRSRKDLLAVRGLGPKTFEQAAGFLRIREAAELAGSAREDGAHPLDASAVHPESYAIVERMASDVGGSVSDLLGNEGMRRRIVLGRYVSEKVGLPTLEDILSELAKPGRDPRARFDPVRFADGVSSIGDLRPGMRLEGIVTNITAFGAFVDVGVHQDGLVHVSQLADRRVKDPGEVVKVQEKVTVTVLEVDLERKRIALTMRSAAAPSGPRGGKEDRASRREPETQMGRLLEQWKKGRSG